jgi:hypothetical protein
LAALRTNLLFNELVMQSLYPQRPNADLIRWLALGSIAGQATWLVVTVVGGLLQPGYSVVSDAVSVLGARDAAHPWLFDVGVAIWGVAFLLAAVALLLDSPPDLRGPRRWSARRSPRRWTG